MTRIYLIRHAEAEGNLYRIAQGQYDSGLTDRGWRQVRALERRFDGVPIDAVCASDLYRTCATASAIYKPRSLPLHRRRDLREICVGDWEQRTWGDIARRWPREMEDFSARMDRWSIPGAETPQEVLDRVRAAVEAIAAENPGRTVAVFSHGYAIRLLLASLQGISLADTGAKSPTGDNTAVSLLEADEAGLRIVFQNDNSHLQTRALPISPSDAGISGGRKGPQAGRGPGAGAVVPAPGGTGDSAGTPFPRWAGPVRRGGPCGLPPGGTGGPSANGRRAGANRFGLRP